MVSYVFLGDSVARFQTVRGTRDILPGETEAWQKVEGVARALLDRYGFREIRTPIFEATELFARGVGASTDIVRKEMYTFASGEDSITLRPEMTASVVRAFIQHGLSRVPGMERLYYIGPMFRRERPQKGRLRQFHQIGVEALGSEDPYIDAETIEMVMAFLRELGLHELRLVVNSVGCNNEDCRPRYRKVLRAWLEAELPSLCEDCHRRFDENPLRVFDCKVEADRERIHRAPTLNDFDPQGPPGRRFRCSECEDHFRRFMDHLKTLGFDFSNVGAAAGPDTTVTIDDRLVRGLDYYVRTAFEVVSDTGLGSQNSLLGGGRYDGLVKELGGPDVPGFGWAMGLERLMMLRGAVPAEGDPPKAEGDCDLFVAHLGEPAWNHAIRLVKDLRARSLSVRLDPRGGKLPRQLERAGREGARFVLIVGDVELANRTYQLRDRASGAQEEVSSGDRELLVARINRGKRIKHAGEN